MNKWKGTEVLIRIYDDETVEGDLVLQDSYLLDTDTIADLFDRFDPRRYQFEIMAWGDNT